MKKKIFGLILVMVMAVSLLASCGGGDSKEVADDKIPCRI